MNCKNCGIEYKPLRKSSFFCSTKCRVSYNRKLTDGSVTKDSVTEPKEVSVTDEGTKNRWGEDVTKMDAKTLYTFIGAYQNDTWKDSPEFKELQKRLKGKILKQLQEEGYWIPSWKNPVRI